MRIDLPKCNLKTCRHSFDGNCTNVIEHNRCEFSELSKEKYERYKGCEFCRNETPYEQQMVVGGDYEDVYIEETDFKYCPYCGRELERGEE